MKVRFFPRSTAYISVSQKRTNHLSPVWHTVQTNPERIRQISGGKMKTHSNPKSGIRPSAVFVTFLLFFLAVMTAEGVSAAGERLTLDEAVRMALTNNHELQAQRNAHAAKGAEIGVARSSLLPG
jgi:hypothetical protein